MKAIAISDITGSSVWSSERSKQWPHHQYHHHHFAPKRSSHDVFYPVNLPPNEDRYSSRSSRVPRSLFGNSDPTETERLACEELNARRSSDRSKWNFDFYKEKPISGRYEWRYGLANNNNNNKDSKFSPGDQQKSFWSATAKNSKKHCEENGFETKTRSNSNNHTATMVHWALDSQRTSH